jgi:hypothetical protein
MVATDTPFMGSQVEPKNTTVLLKIACLGLLIPERFRKEEKINWEEIIIYASFGEVSQWHILLLILSLLVVQVYDCSIFLGNTHD